MEVRLRVDSTCMPRKLVAASAEERRAESAVAMDVLCVSSVAWMRAVTMTLAASTLTLTTSTLTPASAARVLAIEAFFASL